MGDIYYEIAKVLEKKEKVALATLFTRVGSAPRAVGAKYLIRRDGTSLGSIGGGWVEAGAASLGTLSSVDGPLPKGEGSKVLIKISGEKVGFLLGGVELENKILREGETLLKEKKPRVIVLNSENRKMEILLEPIFSEPTVYIFGGGHVSEQLSPLAKKVYFKVVVIDDREIFANRTRFPEADEVIVSEFEKGFNYFNID